MADRFYSKFIRTISAEKKLKFSNLDNSEKTRLLEAKYWQTVQNGKKCEVEYGSDVTPDTVTSGFAGENRLSDENPLKTGWNLRKLPSSKGSLLKHLDEKVSGVNDPWIYFGMLFSSFCWHYEDDSLFSISYNHTGATKLWYGVPGKMASSVEGVFEDLLPELFEEEPDIMMKLVTMISPSVLRAKGIPVVRSEHRAGEFMVTLPNAFHGGFNAGFNVAEAVNFALESWLPEGLRCADRYSTFRRESVLSHERIVLKTAEESDFDAAGAQFVLEALQMILSREKKLRPEFEAGEERLKTRWERHGTESEITQCSVCERKCYLSFVLCNKHQGRVGCLEHAKSFCRCGSNKRNSHRKSLKCSYSIGELESLFSKVEKKVNSRLT